MEWMRYFYICQMKRLHKDQSTQLQHSHLSPTSSCHLWRIIHERVRWRQIYVAQNDKYPQIICAAAWKHLMYGAAAAVSEEPGCRHNGNNTKLIMDHARSHSNSHR